MTIAIQWSDDYSIDIDLDCDHKLLFELANAVFAIEDPKRQLPKVKDAVNALYEYMKVHFRNEQRLMEWSGYADGGTHVAQHNAIIRRTNELVTGSRNLDVLLSGLRHLLLDWLLVHILREDRKLGIHLRRVESSPDGEAQDQPVAVR